MAAAVDLARVGAGFGDAPLASQAVFRRCLAALARPGTIETVSGEGVGAEGLCPAAAALALALLDQDTRLWLSPELARGDAAPYLRFHTGCAIVDDPGRADFALVGSARTLPALDAFPAGTDEYPDRSATIVIQVERLVAGDGWRLSGPGIAREARLRVDGMGGAFVAEWARSRARFPRGVDVFLVCGTALCGLPRT